MNRTSGVVVGVVRNRTDPENLGRIQVQFPWLDDELTTTWASIATPMAGRERGMFFMPEDEDECLVAFDQGCFDHPYIVGFLWNGADTPPNGDIDNSVRRFQSVSGHILEFNDNDGSYLIRLRTQGGHEILLDDSSGSERIHIEDQEGNTVELSASGITLTAGAGKDVSISGTNVNIDATSAINLNATGQLSASGNPVHLNP